MANKLKTDAERLADASAIIRKRNSEITSLKREIARTSEVNDTAESIRTLIFGLQARSPKPPAWISGSGGTSGTRGAPMTMWSDFHYGESVNPTEIGGVNEFNHKIAKSRVKRLVNTTIDLAFNHMGRAKTEYPGVVICLGGDMVGGDLHEELMATNDRTCQQSINDVTDMLAGAIDQMATKFGRVFAPCVVGNHGRTTRKIRFKQHVYTNSDWVVYCNLERYFRGNKHVSIFVPEETDVHFHVFGHRYLLTHGDLLGVKGGDGIIGALGPIMRGSLKIARSESQIGRDFDTLLIGHWHQYLTLPGLIVNNSLKGYDEYARLALRAPYSRPSQALWFSHPEHGITAHWQVYLEKQFHAHQNKEWLSWQA